MDVSTRKFETESQINTEVKQQITHINSYFLMFAENEKKTRNLSSHPCLVGSTEKQNLSTSAPFNKEKNFNSIRIY